MTEKKTNRTWWFASGAVLVVAFLAYGATSFKTSLTPYVSFEEAMTSGNRVQVAGKLVENSSNYVDADQVLRFRMYDDKGVEMAVNYRGVKPANFEEAIQIVAVGSWHDDVFDAEQLLVKCPSKYQGLETDVAKHGAES